MLKMNSSSSLESRDSYFCKRVKSNHFFKQVLNLNIFRELHKTAHICGKNACILCRSNWGDPEEYEHVCFDHE